MGSSESKIAVAAPVNAEPAIKNTRVTCLLDPRSPSANLTRTPIQIGGPGSRTSAMVENECHPAMVDPRSPTVGITRTPVREVMRAKVGSFARRLGMLFYHDTEYKAPQEEEEVFKHEELASTEPLLSPQSSQGFGTMAMHANLLATPVQPPIYSLVDTSPFVLLEEPQVEVDIEAEADISLEEAEEAKESPLHKRLSMSLITCHDGATSSQIFAEVHHDCTSPVPSVEVETFGASVDHSYARPSIGVKPESLVEPSPNTEQDESPVQSSAQIIEAEALPSSEETRNPDSTGSPLPPVTVPPTVPGPEQPQHKGIRCPTFDPKSPSQVVFKPQWLGKDFGAAGLRARGVQGHSGKGSSSPLALRIAVKTVTNENKRQSGKLKQKGTEGRSPLQILQETNSPRDQQSQLKLKASTPTRQRLGHMDSRVLAVALDKENR